MLPVKRLQTQLTNPNDKLFVHSKNGKMYSEEQRDAIVGAVTALCQMGIISERKARHVNANFIHMTFARADHVHAVPVGAFNGMDNSRGSGQNG